MRAAIYSRKSKLTETGDSIENQIELCKKYALTYLNTNMEFLIYEDEGFSGGNSNRPQFQQLLKDAKDKKFKALICYRLDRISRNVADFSSTLELLQENDIDFISIKEQFDTSTPMGRAMVYISSVFAQLERETIAERIRDNMYHLAKTGRYLGGQVPLGFTTERIKYFDEEMNEKCMSKLIRNEEELKLVKLLYSLYLELGSFHYVQKYCLEHHIKGKNGGQLVQRSIADILRNPVYVISNNEVFEYFNNKDISTVGNPNGNGMILYGKRNAKGKKYSTERQIVAVSNHKGIISAKDWLKVQFKMDKNKNKICKREGTSKTGLLSGLLKCAICGSGMRITYNRPRKDGTKKHYYTCSMKCHSGKTRCANQNADGNIIEEKIIFSIMNADKKDILNAFEKKYKTKPQVPKEDTKKYIEDEITNKTKIMDNLLNQLGNAAGPAADFIIKKVNNLGVEINSLKTELIKINNSNDEVKNENRNLEIALNTLDEFKKTFHSISHEGKKEYLNRLIEKVEYNGHTKEINIYYLV